MAELGLRYAVSSSANGAKSNHLCGFGVLGGFGGGLGGVLRVLLRGYLWLPVKPTDDLSAWLGGFPVVVSHSMSKSMVGLGLKRAGGRWRAS